MGVFMINGEVIFPLSFKKNFLYIFFYIFINIIYTSQEDTKNILVIPFKYYKPKVNSVKENKQTNLVNSWLRQKLYLLMENSNGDKCSMILTLEQIEAHSKEDLALIASDEKYVKVYTQNVNDICAFNYENSPNFKCKTPYNIFLHGRERCCLIEEKFVFYKDLKLSEKKVLPFNLIHSTNETNICLFGSLQRYWNAVDKTKSLIDQLKLLSDSKTYTWSLKYTSYDSGLFIFGDIINNEKIEFDENNIKNTEKNYESIYPVNIFTGRIFWKISTDTLFFGEKILGEKEYLEIETDMPFILLKKDYYRFIKEQLFKQFVEEKICEYITPEYQLSSVFCKTKQFLEKTNNLKNCPSLIFQVKQNDLNITFTPNDYFRIEGDDIYFLIAHHSYKDSQCTAGSLFIKKYPTVFDVDSKQMKILKKLNIEDNKPKGNNSVKIFFVVCLSIVFSGIIFGFIGLKYGKKIYQSRRRKANELEDEFEYNQNNAKNDVNYDKKYGLFINNEENKKGNINEIILEMTKS